MIHTLIVNLFLVLLTAVALVHTGNPLCLFALFFLLDFPIHVVTNEQQIRAKMLEDDDDDDDDDPSIGFTAPIK